MSRNDDMWVDETPGHEQRIRSMTRESMRPVDERDEPTDDQRAYLVSEEFARSRGPVSAKEAAAGIPGVAIGVPPRPDSACVVVPPKIGKARKRTAQP